jgi:hypothetical protein
MGAGIAPQSEVTVDTTLDTTSKTNQTQVRIMVYTNDPIGTIGLSLNANVEPFLRAMPPYLQLQDIPQGQERSGTIDVRTTRGEKVLLTEDPTRMVPVPEGFSYELKAINPDPDGRSNQWQVTMRVSGDAPEGARGYGMTLLTDVPLPATPEVKTSIATGKQIPTVYNIAVNVNYRVLGIISMAPQYLSLGLVRPGSPVVRNV